jgi:thiol-disulfide isomerase/thioredoxin
MLAHLRSRRLLSPLVLALMVGLSAFACQADAAQESKLVLKGLDHGALSDADLQKGTTILIVFAGWSPRCRDVISRVNGIHGKWGSQARIGLVDFQEPEGDIRAFLKDRETPVPIYLDSDGEFSKRYAVTQLPYLLIIRNGKTLSQGRLPEDADRTISTALK